MRALWLCLCIGFTGTFCEMDINECETQPCRNGATCNDLRGRYQCDCLPGRSIYSMFPFVPNT